ncbi:MAG: alpha/beta hydrolase [Anaerolineales bacterium]|nr:alpha/beta hydrolase [Anaerolineales bacterium]MCB8953585.1 alpha/beta hydrolase [Ardenticatenales bacterium]
MEEIWIETPKGTVYGRYAGIPGNPLILGIHGWSQQNGWHTWEPLLPPLGAAGMHAVSIDMPGWGQSPAWEPGPLLPAAGVPVILSILDSLDAPTASLMGKSWGGSVAIETALRHPGRITHLILTAPAFRDWDRLAGLTQPMLLAWAQDDPVIPFHYAAQFVDAIPHCQLQTYPTGGHNAAPENAAHFAPIATKFLQ